jgi:hypothetical protein
MISKMVYFLIFKTKNKFIKNHLDPFHKHFEEEIDEKFLNFKEVNYQTETLNVSFMFYLIKQTLNFYYLVAILRYNHL